MMKRTLSFVLCLIMVLSLAAPCVQASSGDNAYALDDYVYTSDSTMDNVVIKNNAGANIVYDDNVIISQDTDTTLTNPADLITEPNTLSATVVEKVCQCADLASAVDHPGVCLVKAPYMKLCETTAQELFALWGIYTAEEQEFIREYLQNKYPAKYNEFLDILADPHSSASETLADGTVVSVEGIPEYSSLTVGQTSDEVKDIVNDYVAQKEDGSRELFGYDVSVQDSDGADWQPDETVKMELELPGKKLHKNTQVYVVHVDDNGVATTIKASVNEEGKIVFETPGFSAFYGFTVDFDYEGVSFCIPGMTSIELSELMENLNMPLDAKDVVNVEYTDETQLKITKLEGDWLLTSLKEFTTEEKLTLTMADGSVYHIKVTDDITGKRATFEMTLQNGTYYRNVDANSNGVVQLYLDNTGRPSSDDWSTYSDQYQSWLTQPLEIDGLKGDAATGGTIEIVLQKKSSYKGTDCVLKILCLKIYGDANVIIRLGDTFSGNDTVRITRSWGWVAANGWKKERALIDIYNGSLFFNINSESSSTNDDIEEAKKTLAAGADVTSHNNSKERKIILDGGHTTDHSRMSKQAPIIYCGLKAKKLMINNTIFRNNGFRGIYVLATEMSVFRIRDSEFESSVHYMNGGGGAIRFEKTCTNTDLNEDFGYSEGGETSTEVVDMKDLDLIHVKFNGNSTATAEDAGGDGGAFQILANPESIDMVDCEFVNCHANSHGGAIALSGAGGYADITIKDCTFTGCNANARGGAIYHDQVQTTTTFTVQGCTFTSCTAGTYGGGISIYGTTTTTNLNNNSFSKCSAGTLEKIYVSGSTTEQAKDAYGNLKYNGNGGGGGIMVTGKHVNVNIKGTASKKQSFSQCYTYNNGGAIGFEGSPCDITGTLTLDHLDIDGCQARDSGSAISLTTVQIQTMIFSNSIVQNCSYSKNRSNAYENSLAAKDKNGKTQTEETPFEDIVFLTQDAGGTFRTTGATRAQLTISSVTFKKNAAHNGGAGVYWNANRLAPSTSETSCTWKPSLTITGCTFEDNTALRDGGGVYVEASLSLTSCTFTGNIANRGGAIAQQIYNQSGRPIQEGESNALTLDSNTTISGNYARTHGGGISIVCNATSSITTPMAYPITFTLGGASVTGNRAAQDGGGIYFMQESYTSGSLDQQMVEKYIKTCTLDSGTISGNYAGYGLTNLKAATAAPTGSGHGGGVYLQVEKNATLNIMGSTIQSNTAHEGNGGGVYMTGTGGKCTVKKNSAGTVSTIGGAANKGNVATSANNNNNQGNGGGLAIFGGATIDLQYGTISYNSADTAGGGIAINNAKVTAVGGTVSHNKAQYGGGISLVKSGTPATIVDESDGAKPNANANWGMTFSNGSVTDNVASVLGGGICLSNTSTMKLSGGSVLRNYAATPKQSGTGYSYADGQNGGGIAVCQGSCMNIYSGEIKSNHAYHGGGITVQGGSMLQLLPTAGSTAAGTVSNNAAQYRAGGIYLAPKATNSNQNTLYIDNGTIQSNTALDGAGIYADLSSKAKLNGGLIYNNSASNHGGGVYGYAATITISGAELSTNHGNNSGGGVYLKSAGKADGYVSSNLTISGGSIHNNDTQKGWGGGIYIWSSSSAKSQCTITGGKIYQNKTVANGTNGGGINAENYTNLTIEGGEIYENFAKGLGGGLHIYNYAVATIKGGEIRNNTSDVGGGGLAVHNLAEVTVTTSNNGQNIGKIMNNTSAKGGGVYVYLSGQLTLDNGYIINNKAVGTPAATVCTGHLEAAALSGAGGGVYVADGLASSTKSSVFTLTGEKIAIYGNTAEFIGDDVFSNGNKTQLTIPTVENMDLDGFDFPAEGWVEDYCTEDENYVSNGLNMIQLHMNRVNANEIPDDLDPDAVSRYRNTPAMHRNYMLIEPEYVTGKNTNGTSVSGNYVNMANAYIAMTLGIPGAVDDTIVVDYYASVNINLWQNDMFMAEDDFKQTSNSPIGVGSAIGWTFPSNTISNNSIHYTSGANKAYPVGTYPSNYASLAKPYGSAYNGKNGALTYVPTQIAFTGVDQFFYTVLHKGYWYYAKITVIPATTLYFDDNNSIKYHTNTDSTQSLASWTTDGSVISKTQDEDRPGDTLTETLDKNNVYGHDSTFGNTKTYTSNGAHKVTVSRHTAVDNNGDGVCDKCKKIVTHNWKDSNGDGKCDTCLVQGTHHCKDTNKDNKCDTCKKWMKHICSDANGDYRCDICGGWYTHSWTDGDSDCSCNLCGDALHHTCPTDKNGDYLCDYCKRIVSHTCKDTTGDYWCDYCHQWMKHTWVDQNKDNRCDKCLNYNHHVCTDLSGDHRCDHCSHWLKHTCSDSNKDYWCDYCHQWMKHTWKDSNNDWICDVCGHVEHHTCLDENRDDKCDTCSRYLRHTCVDNIAPKNLCDVCGDATGTHTINARASFTFTGTGFDIISLCSVNTGTVMVNVYRGSETVNFDNPDSSRRVASYMVNTFLRYRYDENSQQWVEASTSDTNIYKIYQVPVIKADLTHVMVGEEDANPDPNVYEPRYLYEDFGYGTYTVEIYVSPSFRSTEAGYNSADFYLDAVRIYNPAGLGEFKNSVTNSTIQNAYTDDHEGWPEYTELRNLFIDQANLSSEEHGGIIFIDGTSNPTLATYKSWGPNNEIYLNPGQHVAFKMDTKQCTNVDAIHIGMKTLSGTGKVQIYSGTSASNRDFMAAESLTSTDMYYRLDRRTSSGTLKIDGKVIVISNTGKAPISITNIKVTHTAAPAYAVSYKMFKASAPIAQVALDILSADELVDHPAVTPERPALSFNGMVCYNVFYSAPNMGDLPCEDVGLAVFSTEDTEGTIETAREVIYGATLIDGMYMTATSGVHAKNLGDRQYFRAFAKAADGSIVYSKMVSYSAVDYAMNVLEKSNDVKLKQLVTAMLNYGAEAQKFFGYDTNNLMNKNLTAEHQALLAGLDANSLNTVGKVDPSKVGAFVSNNGFSKRSPAISFKGAFEINYFFTPANAVNDGVTLYLWNEDTYNSVDELTAENADKVVDMVMDSDGVYTAATDEIAAKYLDKTVYVAAVYQCDNTTYCSGVLPYSIAQYRQAPPASVQDLATAAAIYGSTAKQYFGV